jgi:diguanylate cyclase (GGDEF)-like protein
MAAVSHASRDRALAVGVVLTTSLAGVVALTVWLTTRNTGAAMVFVTTLVQLAVAGSIRSFGYGRDARHAAAQSHPSVVLDRDEVRPRRALIQAIQAGIANDGSAAVLLFDLDGFKLVNEAFGHDVGDHLIDVIHQRLVSAAGESATVFHLGGDEYGLVLGGPIGLVTTHEQAAFLADLVASPISIVGLELAVTASVGVALGSKDDLPISVLDHASTAIHRAKRLGGRRVVLYDDALRSEARDRLALSTSLRHAVDRDELIVEFQTINNLTSGTPFAVEALVRWQHPTLGLLYPERFIPLAEDTGAIEKIGRWVLDTACREIAGLDAAMKKANITSAPLQLWVNVSPKQLTSLDLVEDVRTALSTHGIAPSRLTLEITENSLIDDVDGAADVLGALKAIGLRLAIDDFGTGYSALSYLDQLPVDALKIDRRFVSALQSAGDSAVLANVISLGVDKGLQVIAEGVETVEQQLLLRRLGCVSAQGWFYSRAVSAELLTRAICSGTVRPHR